MLHVAPISHGSGYLFLPMWLGGGRNILASSFDAPTVLNTLADERVAYFFAVPTMLADIAHRVGGARQDLPDLKVVMVSGAPISAKTATSAHDVFGDTLYQMYGQTEAVPVTFMGPREWFRELAGSDPLVSPAGSCRSRNWRSATTRTSPWGPARRVRSPCAARAK